MRIEEYRFSVRTSPSSGCSCGVLDLQFGADHIYLTAPVLSRAAMKLLNIAILQPWLGLREF